MPEASQQIAEITTQAQSQDATIDAAQKPAEPTQPAVTAEAAEQPQRQSRQSEKKFSKAELEQRLKAELEAARAKWESEKDLSEAERIKRENEELRNAIRMRDARDEIISQLQAAGNQSPELAFLAIKDQLKFADDGKLQNAADLIEKLKTEFPEQFGKPKTIAPPADAGAGTAAGREQLTAEKLAAMTPQQIMRLDWETVKKVISQQ